AWRVILGSIPRNMSLAPSSTMTASVPSGTDQSRRASPLEAVSPETPALVISTARPLVLSACSSFAGKASSADRPRPAVREPPNTPIRTGRSAAAVAGAHIATASASAISANVWTGTLQVPYDRGGAVLPATEGTQEQRNMHDTSPSGRSDPAI